MARKKPAFDPGRQAFIINPKADEGNIVDAISERIKQARSLALIMSDQGGEEDSHFSTWSAEVRENYFWALDRKIEELNDLFDAFTDIRIKNKEMGNG